MAALNRGRKILKETKARISAARIGRLHTTEHKAKISAAIKDVWKSEEIRAKILAAKTGVKVSDEKKAKMSAAQMGNKNRSVSIEILDMETGDKNIYASMIEAEKALAWLSKSISRYFSRNAKNPYKGRYVIKKIVN